MKVSAQRQTSFAQPVCPSIATAKFDRNRSQPDPTAVNGTTKKFCGDHPRPQTAPQIAESYRIFPHNTAPCRIIGQGVPTPSQKQHKFAPTNTNPETYSKKTSRFFREIVRFS
jgi:hypothetical protein